MLKWVLVPKMAESDIVTLLHDAAFLILALPSMYFDTHENASVWTALYPVFVRGKRILPHIKAGKQRRSFRKSSTIAALYSTNPSALSPISGRPHPYPVFMWLINHRQPEKVREFLAEVRFFVPSFIS